MRTLERMQRFRRPDQALPYHLQPLVPTRPLPFAALEFFLFTLFYLFQNVSRSSCSEVISTFFTDVQRPSPLLSLMSFAKHCCPKHRSPKQFAVTSTTRRPFLRHNTCNAPSTTQTNSSSGLRSRATHLSPQSATLLRKASSSGSRPRGSRPPGRHSPKDHHHLPIQQLTFRCPPPPPAFQSDGVHHLHHFALPSPSPARRPRGPAWACNPQLQAFSIASRRQDGHRVWPRFPLERGLLGQGMSTVRCRRWRLPPRTLHPFTSRACTTGESH